MYGLPIWGFSTQGRQNVLLTKQKKAIRKIFNLPYRQHTLPYFYEASILRLPELIQHTTMCYIHSGLARFSPLHIQALWRERVVTRENLRDRGNNIEYPLSQKQWINALPPIAQAKLWNKSELNKAVDPPYYKTQSKLMFLKQYHDEIHSNPELYSEYIDSKKQKVSNFTNKDADCIIL